MKIDIFVDKLINEKIEDIDNFYTLVECAIDEYEHPENLDEIRNKIQKINQDKITDFGDKVGLCSYVCGTKLEALDASSTERLYEKTKNFRIFLDQIAEITQERCNAFSKSDEEPSDVDTLENKLNDVAFQELLNNVIDVRNQLNLAVEKANDRIDSKIFSLLINTVAVLGIFVAIAFSGFGVLSIISSLDVETMTSSSSGFIKSVFFMLFIGFLSYNLLILLVYFIFKLSRPILLNRSDNLKSTERENSNVDDEQRFRQLIRLKPFLIIDGILFALTVAAFIASLDLGYVPCPLLGF